LLREVAICLLGAGKSAVDCGQRHCRVLFPAVGVKSLTEQFEFGLRESLHRIGSHVETERLEFSADGSKLRCTTECVEFSRRCLFLRQESQRNLESEVAFGWIGESFPSQAFLLVDIHTSRDY